ncbi:MAG: penicillin-binding protein 1C [Ignavibacteriaceae bacterium]
MILILLFLNLLFPFPPEKQFSKVIYASDGSLLAAYLTEDDKWRLHVELKEISPDLVKAIVEKEDKWFYWHPGFNPVAMFRALIDNITSGEIKSGASTITMQTARILRPAKRTYFAKLIEIFRALQLELNYSKTEILEMYLSLLPYGGNIEGVKSASYIYFNRPPSKLSLSQAILLTIIPNNPNNYRLDRQTDKIVKKRNDWINRFSSENVFNESILEDAKNEPVLKARYELPLFAPHFCNYVAGAFNESKLITTLNTRIQRIAEDLLKNYISRINSMGVSNGAILVIDNRNHSVVAYCGSSDFTNSYISGQVNGITAVRSPGSALKPALYAFAFDMGIITPKMKLLDIPTDFGGYEPENFNPVFNGEVTVEFALLNSLNVPAVNLLQKTGYREFIQLLKKVGFNSLSKDESRLGLSLILGGCGTTLEELTRLFSVFANKGRLFPINYLRNNDFSNISKEILSPEASYLISEILSKNERPDYSNLELTSTSNSKFAWKTGTSYGKRDAWAIGYNQRFTIGVWLGNFDGKGSPFLTGAGAAVPLLTELFNSVDRGNNKSWFAKPDNISARMVCKETGLLPGPHCREQLSDFFIRNVSTNKICDLYKEVFVDKEEKVSYCKECLPQGNYKINWYPVYPPELKLWFAGNNIKKDSPPGHNPDCEAKFSASGPVILSPSANFDYLVENNSGQQILLSAASDSQTKIHYWYLNDEFYKKCKPDERVFFTPVDKEIKITCIDDFGRNSSITVRVSYY